MKSGITARQRLDCEFSSEPVGHVLVLVGGVKFKLHPTFAGSPAMDPWKECAALEECRDAVRRWAVLEGKSQQMIEDLTLSHVEPSTRSLGTTLLIATGVRAAAWAVQTWWHITRR